MQAAAKKQLQAKGARTQHFQIIETFYTRTNSNQTNFVGDQTKWEEIFKNRHAPALVIFL